MVSIALVDARKTSLTGVQNSKKIGSPLRGSWMMVSIALVDARKTSLMGVQNSKKIGSPLRGSCKPPLGKKLDPPLFNITVTDVFLFHCTQLCNQIPLYPLLIEQILLWYDYESCRYMYRLENVLHVGPLIVKSCDSWSFSILFNPNFHNWWSSMSSWEQIPNHMAQIMRTIIF